MTESRSVQLAVHVVETPEAGGADLHFVRHPHLHPTHNPIAMNRLNLCPHNSQNLGLVRHPTPAHVADLSFVRHERPSQTSNPNTMSHLSLYPHKHQSLRAT
jgi:hypothetical protein